jgi:putative membrane protein
MVMTMSFAPLGSDDLDTEVEVELAKFASEAGLELSVVDAHNSIDHAQQTPVTDDPGWRRLFESIKAERSEHFRIAFSNSGELGFKGQSDLTENGIGLFMLQKSDAKSVLVLADANNSIPALRAKVAEALASSGFDLIEFCTSDSHNLAARGLTVSRGYEALGEVTPPQTIIELVIRMAELAETRLATAAYGSGLMKSKVRIFGSKALQEFADLTQSSSMFSRTYLKFAVVAVTALLLASIIF